MVVPIVTSILGAILSKVFGCICDSIVTGRYGYVFEQESKIKNLNQQFERLKRERERVQDLVDVDKRKGEDILPHVKRWLERVHEKTEFVEKLLEDADSGNKRCSIGVRCRCKIAKEAEKEVAALVQLAEEAGRFDTVSSPAPPVGPTSVRGYEAFQSRMETLKAIMEALIDPNINVIGVHGLPGVGKTTLVKEVARRAKEEKLFDEVVMSAVTDAPDLRNIQAEIRDKLGLQFHEESVAGRAGRLYDGLKQLKKVLVILDDVWTKLDLEAVGIPFGDDHNGCKILLTSRDLNVLSSMMNTQRNFPIGILPDGEAWDFFKKMAGDCVESPDLQATAIEVAKKCGGLPIALATVAKALRNKELFEWKNALRQLKTPSPGNFSGIPAAVYSAIALSYNHLESEVVKPTLSFFSIMGYNADIEDVLKYVVGLGLFCDINTIEEARDKLYTLVSDLKASCMLLESYHIQLFNMHDMVRDVALSIASRDQRVFSVRYDDRPQELRNKDLLGKCFAICLRYSNISELPEGLDCPHLKFFYIGSKDPSLKVPENFFKGMQKLKVLDLTKMDFSVLPPSIPYLAELRTLCLDHCVLGDITVIGELKNLEILSLFSCVIQELPVQLSQLTQLRMLDLRYCHKLEVIPPNVISSLSKLEELYLGNSPVQWKLEGQNNQRNASLSELKNLCRLSVLYIQIWDVQVIPKDFFSEKLQRYRIFIGDVWKWSGKYQNSKTLKLQLSTNIHSEYYGFKTLLNQIEDLYLDDLKGVPVLYELDAKGFGRCLKQLHIQNSPEINYVFNSIGAIPCHAFPILDSLYLHNLINLENICQGPITERAFSKLRIIEVCKCDRLNNLFSHSMARGLSQLEEVEVTDCKNLTKIVAERIGDCFSIDNVTDRIEFSQLRSLTLQNLPKLASISSEGEPGNPPPLFNLKVFLPKLEELKLSSINIQKIWLDQPPAMSYYVKNLTKLVVEGCSCLKYLFPSFMVENLVQLQSLKICDCKVMRRVIFTEEGRSSRMLFPKLDFLLLQDLPELTRFCSADLVEFSSLRELVLNNCPLLKTFISSNEIEGYNSEEHLHTGKPALFNEKVGLPILEGFAILNMRCLQKLWHHQLAVDSFCKLSYIEMAYCQKLLNIFPFNIVERLQRLHEVNISCCPLLEEIFEQPDEHQEINAEARKFESLQLRKLKLSKLPALMHIWREGFHSELLLQDIRTIEILEYSKLRSLVPFSVSFPNLRMMEVSRCHEMIHLVAPSTAKSMVQLTRIRVSDCKRMEEVIAQMGYQLENIIVFRKLVHLELESLPSLESFCLGNYSMEFPSLEEAIMPECPKMKIFSGGSLSTPNLQRLQLADGEVKEHWNGNLNATVQQLFTEMNSKQD